MDKRVRYLIVLSVLFNVISLTFFGYMLYKKGGVKYIKSKMASLMGFSYSNNSKYFNWSYDLRTNIFKYLPQTNGGIVFLGDSLTEYGELGEFFGQNRIRNRGIQGDTTFGVLNRLNEVTESTPEKIFLMIGINDILNGIPIHKSLENYGKIVEMIKSNKKGVDIYIHSVLPVDENIVGKFNNKIIEYNKSLKVIAETKNVYFVDIYYLYVNDKNEVKNGLFSRDGAHLTGRGYLLWKSAIDNLVFLSR